MVPFEQYNEYRACVPMDIDILSFEGQGIGAKREAILHLKPNGKIIMMDDDLMFYKRTQDGSKFLQAHRKETEFMVEDMSKFLDTYPMVGLTDKFMSQHKPRISVESQRFNQCWGINRDLLPNPWPRFRIPHDEEHDFHLQLLTQGYRTVVLTEWTKTSKDRAPGGCSDWRTADVMKITHDLLLSYWPGIVTITPDPNNPAMNRARYKWREAKRIGGI
jgi:hypothetical protein